MDDDTPALATWILEQVSDALIYADRSGNIVRWNQAASELFGYSADEALGHSLDLIIPEHLRAAHWAGFNAALSKGETRLQGRPTLTRATHQDGRKLYVEMTFALVKDRHGHAIGSVAVARDATERIKAQRTATQGRNPAV